ncbi:MAG: Response regulator receiver domain-containing protein [uncultured Aureispira sp.]|uniref:Response regulator receiver domain-containing protein n=1 Tax=uncultured Aureispira sp. TaxID=1331704 RepID=A0A6S6TDM8_9BACT|nr:MAG: Response regulator receiver domain-containing protein [uncultured Aureispira sp.]
MEGKKIFIVEDDMIIQMFIERILENLGLNIIGEARTGDETLAFLEQEHPDFILMDIGLAGNKDGIETAEIINQKYQIPIIFLTGNSDKPTLARAKKTNPIGFINKPIDEASLKSVMQKYFNNERS